MKKKIWQKFSVLCMVLALMMPSIVQATEIVATSEAEVSTDKMAEETSEKTEVSSEKLSVKDENLQAEPVVQENVTTVIYDEVEFELNNTDDTARVVAYHGTGGHVNIPATVFWKNLDFYVTCIGEGAFLSKEITSVSLGPYIQSISNFAFNDNQLTSISFPNSLIWIGHSAFAYNQLTSVVIPDSVTTIQYAAFFNNQLESVHLGRGISSLDASVLGENNLLELNIPSSITTVGAHAFQDNPLYYLNTEVEHIETLRYALDQTSMNLVLNRVILRALDYVAGTEREVETIPGENIKFQLSKQYRLRSTADRVWEEYIPTVQWFKNDASLSGETNLLLQLGSVTPEDSGVYHAVVDGVRFPDLTLEVIDESIEQSEFEFEFSGTDGNSTATLIGYNGAGGDVVIPSETVNREAGWESSSPVTVIGRSAFYGKQLTNVTIPDGVTSLVAFAFYDNQLTNVELPDTITNIGSYVFALNELTDIYIPDSVRNFEARVFEGNPLRYIETNRDNLLNLRMIINPAVVLPNVTETTVLRALEYTEETEINSEVVIGSHVHYQISNQYIIGGLEWMEHLPTVYWFKDDIQIADQTGKGIVIQDLQESDSGIYKAIVDGTPFPDLQLEVIPEIEPEIPAIDPSEPPASPENVNPDVAGLSIRYASDIHFKSAPFSISDQDLFLDSQENQPMVTIQDMRPKSERSGWELLVSQDTSFMNGAEIVMNPFIHQANQDNLLIDPSSELVLNDAPQRFAGTTTNQSNPFGIVSMGMESEGKPMRLRVPEKTGIGSYETTVHWQLVTGP